MYGLWWFIGIFLLIVGLLVWLDAYAKHRRKRRLDVYAAWNLIALGLGGLVLALGGLIAKLCGAPAATMVEVQYYFSNRFRLELLAGLRTLLGYAGGQTLNLLLGSAFLLALGWFILRLHPRLEGAGDELPKKWRTAQSAIRYGVPVLSCAFLSNPLAKFFLGLDGAHRYIAAQGFFLTANPADMWHFHALAIYILCLLVPYFVLKYWATVSRLPATPEKRMRAGLILLLPALAICYFLIRVLTPALGVTLYSLLVALLIAVMCNCFDIQAAKKKRKARYTKRENEILDLLGLDLVWAENVAPAEARQMARKMKDNGDSELVADIYARLVERGQEE